MGNFSFNVPALGTKFIDYRNQILGDSFNWSWVHPLSEYKYLVIHHAAGPDNQTPDDIARYHVQSRGWGGIGYHFVINRSGTVFYVGDLTTARAHVLNMNHLAIGICLIGSFIDGKEPTNEQYQSMHELCAQMLFRTPELSGTDGWEDVVGHKNLGSTRCPGDTWDNWRPKVISGTNPPPSDTNRVNEITKLYEVILGRTPDQEGLKSYVESNWSIDEICRIITESQEHKEILNKANNFKQAQTLATESIAHVSQTHKKLVDITLLGK